MKKIKFSILYLNNYVVHTTAYNDWEIKLKIYTDNKALSRRKNWFKNYKAIGVHEWAQSKLIIYFVIENLSISECKISKRKKIDK